MSSINSMWDNGTTPMARYRPVANRDIGPVPPRRQLEWPDIWRSWMYVAIAFFFFAAASLPLIVAYHLLAGHK